MSNQKIQIIKQISSQLENFDRQYYNYYHDAEPASIYDSDLQGLLYALKLHCNDLGWNTISEIIQNYLPVSYNAAELFSIIDNYILPELRIKSLDQITQQNLIDNSFWTLINVRIELVSKNLFNNGFFAESVERAFKEINTSVKELMLNIDGIELDGSRLMQTAFSPNNPKIRLDDLDTESGRNIQNGYMQIFAGSMTGIRNPKAHANLKIDSNRAIHLLFLASLLMNKLEERVE